MIFCESDINGTIVKSFIACKKQGWLAARKLSPISTMESIQIGTAYNNIRNTQRRFGGVEVDEVIKGQHFIVREYKKTFSNIEASKIQLLFYMYSLQKELNLQKIEGYVISEETDEKVYLILDDKNKKVIEKLIKEIIIVIQKTTSPKFELKPLCPTCGHNLYCL